MRTIPITWKARHGLMGWTNLAGTPERAASKAQPVLLSHESDTEASPSKLGFVSDDQISNWVFSLQSDDPKTQYPVQNTQRRYNLTNSKSYKAINGWLCDFNVSVWECKEMDRVSKEGSRMDTWTLPPNKITGLRGFLWKWNPRIKVIRVMLYVSFTVSQTDIFTGIVKLHLISIRWVNQEQYRTVGVECFTLLDPPFFRFFPSTDTTATHRGRGW